MNQSVKFTFQQIPLSENTTNYASDTTLLYKYRKQAVCFVADVVVLYMYMKIFNINATFVSLNRKFPLFVCAVKCKNFR